MINKKFKLFECCEIVKGFNNGIIIDFQRKQFHIFPNSVLNELEFYNGKIIYQLFSDYKESNKTLKKYINYFLKNELVHIADDFECFPIVSNEFIKAFPIDTLCIELSGKMKLLKEFSKIKIDQLGANCIKLIIKKFDKPNLQLIMNSLENTKIKQVAVFVNYQKDIELELLDLFKSNIRIYEIIVFNSPFNQNSTKESIYFDKLDIENVLFKKINTVNDFTLNIDAFNESLKFNLMYNRTLFLDKNGNLKNTIKDTLSLGNVKNLLDIADNKQINDFWSINKDKIEVCKDCEFRYICPDGRVPIKNNLNDEYYTHEEECNYNPYENTWN